MGAHLTRVDPSAPLVRSIRAVSLALPTVGTASLAHAAVGGCAPATAIALSAAVAVPTAYAVLRVRQQVVGLLAWILSMQVITHALMDVLCGQPHASHTAAMLIGHTLAAALLAALLARNDTCLWVAEALLAPFAEPKTAVPQWQAHRVPDRSVTVKVGGAPLPAVSRGPPQLLAA